jgi:CTP:molybdopterin cytidylyltransferase MocA
MMAAPVAWILAAGLGRRMGGCPKAAIRLDGPSILETLTQALLHGGCGRVHVMVGPYADVLRPLAAQAGALVSEVSAPDGSLLDTQADAIRLHLAEYPGSDMAVTVADLPLLRAFHVGALLAAWHESDRQHAMAPRVATQRGHPLILPHALVPAIADQAQGRIRPWLEQHPDSLTPWDVQEPAYITDLDTHDDVIAMTAQLRQKSHRPTSPRHTAVR